MIIDNFSDCRIFVLCSLDSTKDEGTKIKEFRRFGGLKLARLWRCLRYLALMGAQKMVAVLNKTKNEQ